MRGNAYSPTSLESELSEADGVSSKRLASENLSVILNIDKTVAKSRQILQESLEVSRKNHERRAHLEERLKHILSLNESSIIDPPPALSEPKKSPALDYSLVSMPTSQERSPDLRFLYEEEQLARERAESQVTDLRKRIAAYEHLNVQYDKVVEDLKDAREELRNERAKARDFSEYHVTKEKQTEQTVQELETAVRKLKGECDRKEEDRAQLERTQRKADEQRGELLREAELQRQTMADLKKLHLREMEETHKRLEEVTREKADLERQLRDAREDNKLIVRKERDSIQTHITELEAKLSDFQLKYSQQLSVNQDLQLKLQSHTQSQHEYRQSQDLVQVFESQMMENTRKIQELQLQLNESKSHIYDNSDDSGEELARMVRKEQERLGLSGVLKPRNENKCPHKAKDLKRVYSSVPRKRQSQKTETQKRTYSKCKFCQ